MANITRSIQINKLINDYDMTRSTAAMCVDLYDINFKIMQNNLSMLGYPDPAINKIAMQLAQIAVA